MTFPVSRQMYELLVHCFYSGLDWEDLSSEEQEAFDMYADWRFGKENTDALE